MNAESTQLKTYLNVAHVNVEQVLLLFKERLHDATELGFLVSCTLSLRIVVDPCLRV